MLAECHGLAITSATVAAKLHGFVSARELVDAPRRPARRRRPDACPLPPRRGAGGARARELDRRQRPGSPRRLVQGGYRSSCGLDVSGDGRGRRGRGVDGAGGAFGKREGRRARRVGAAVARAPPGSGARSGEEARRPEPEHLGPGPAQRGPGTVPRRVSARHDRNCGDALAGTRRARGGGGRHREHCARAPNARAGAVLPRAGGARGQLRAGDRGDQAPAAARLLRLPPAAPVRGRLPDRAARGAPELGRDPAARGRPDRRDDLRRGGRRLDVGRRAGRERRVPARLRARPDRPRQRDRRDRPHLGARPPPHHPRVGEPRQRRRRPRRLLDRAHRRQDRPLLRGPCGRAVPRAQHRRDRGRHRRRGGRRAGPPPRARRRDRDPPLVDHAVPRLHPGRAAPRLGNPGHRRLRRLPRLARRRHLPPAGACPIARLLGHLHLHPQLDPLRAARHAAPTAPRRPRRLLRLDAHAGRADRLRRRGRDPLRVDVHRSAPRLDGQPQPDLGGGRPVARPPPARLVRHARRALARGRALDPGDGRSTARRSFSSPSRRSSPRSSSSASPCHGCSNGSASAPSR